MSLRVAAESQRGEYLAVCTDRRVSSDRSLCRVRQVWPGVCSVVMLTLEVDMSPTPQY